MALTDKAASPRRPIWVVWIETLIKKELKEIKHVMTDTKALQIETKKDLERLIQSQSAQSAKVDELQKQNTALQDQFKGFQDQIKALQDQIAAGGGDPAVVTALQAQVADLQKQVEEQGTGLQELDDLIEAASPETPVTPPVEPPTA
jgi:chromosome segregation ATPase